MSSSTPSTSNYIDDKKNDSTNEPSPNFTKFYSQIIYSVIKILISISIGCILLYICKLSQTNIFQNINEIINGNDYNDNDEKTAKQEKIIKNKVFDIIDMIILKDYKKFLGKYGLGFLSSEKPEVYTVKVDYGSNEDKLNENLKLIKKIEKALFYDEKNYINKKDFDEKEKALNSKKLKPTNNSFSSTLLWFVYNVINSSLTTYLWFMSLLKPITGIFTESLLLLLFSLFSSVFLSFVLILIIFIVIFYMILNLPKLYESKSYGIKNGEIKTLPTFFYDSRNLLYIFTYSNFILFLLFIFGIFFVFAISFFILGFFIYICLSVSGKILNKNKNFGFFDFVKSILNYKKQLIVLLFSFNIYADVIQNLGNKFIISFLVAIVFLLLYTNSFSSYKFNSDVDINMTPHFVNYSNNISKSNDKDIETLKSTKNIKKNRQSKNYEPEVEIEKLEEQQPQPQVEEQQPQPQVEEQQPQPQVEEQQPQPQVEEQQPQPQIEEQQPQPQIEEQQPQPQIEEQQPQPQIEEQQPQSQIEQPQPQIEEQQPQPQIEEQQPQPQIEEQQPQPQIEEQQPQPQIEEQQPQVEKQKGGKNRNKKISIKMNNKCFM